MEIRGQISTFKLIAGPLKWYGKPLKDTFVIEVHYEDSEEKHKRKLPLGGFGSMLCFDYADKAGELVDKFCEENKFVLNNHLNSWPEYQAVISKIKN